MNAAVAPLGEEVAAAFRALAADSPDALLVVDASGTIRLANLEAERLTGFPPAVLLGRPLASLLSQLRSDRDAPRARLLRSDATEVPVAVTVSPLDVPGAAMTSIAVRDLTDREAVVERWRATEARLQEAEKLAHLGSWTWDSRTDSITWSAEMYRIFGLDAEGEPITLARYTSGIHPDDRAWVLAALRTGSGQQVPLDYEYRIIRPDGEQRWIHFRAFPAVSGREVLRMSGFGQDVTERKVAEQRRAAAQDALGWQQQVLERIATGEPLEGTLELLCLEIERRVPGTMCSILVADAGGDALSPAAGPSLPRELHDALRGLRIAEGVGACGTAAARQREVVIEDLFSDPLALEWRDLARNLDLRSVASYPVSGRDGRILGTFALYRRDVHRPDPAQRRAVATVTRLLAVALERALADAALAKAARIDPLTGLPNRTVFLDHLSAALAEKGRPVGVMFLDLDRFKWINDSLGHSVGDALLVKVGNRLQDSLRSEDVLARFGGDEFTILVVDAQPPLLESIARRVTEVFREPFSLDGGEFFVSASIGIAVNDHEADAASLIRDADNALYAAKDRGRGRITFFDMSLRDRAHARLSLEADMRRGLERGEFIVHYQPMRDVRRGTWRGVEALVRWSHPTLGMLPPGRFIPLAEETGLIVPLGTDVLEKATAQAAAWAHGGLRLEMAVNLSVVQLDDPDIVTQIASALRRHDLPADRLMVEVTETALGKRLDRLQSVLTEIARLGVPIAIDDFGTGYSSVARLGDLPVSWLKIDRRFAAGLGDEPSAARIFGAITQLAHAYDMRVIAEGIETAAALRSARHLRADVAQGYHLAGPAPAGEIEQMLLRAVPGALSG